MIVYDDLIILIQFLKYSNFHVSNRRYVKTGGHNFKKKISSLSVMNIFFFFTSCYHLTDM